jgi:hypothetical protein
MKKDDVERAPRNIGTPIVTPIVTPYRTWIFSVLTMAI